jgi:hypothetical protein
MGIFAQRREKVQFRLGILPKCADAARADYLITDNQRHFPKFWKKTKIITTREFISLAAPHLIK